MKEISTGYEPRSYQVELHQKLRRFSAIAAHRRFGKSIFAINHTINAGIKCRFPNPQYALISPLLSQSKRNLWGDLKLYTKNFPVIDIHENDLRIDIWRAKDDRIRIQLFGAENPDSIAGYKLDGAFLDEAQDHNPSFFGRIVRPMLSDRRGWALFMGTVRGRNYFWQLRQRFQERMVGGDPDYFHAEFKASETGLIQASELADAKIEMGDELYNQEYELSTDSPNKGSYYGEYVSHLEKIDPPRITNLPYDPRLDVDTAWDLGVDDQSVCWFYQVHGQEIRVIDYMEGQGKGIPEYANLLKMKPYGYGVFKLPHDAAVRELGTGQSREEIFRSRGFRTEVLPRQSVADGIQAVRVLLSRCWFDAVKCKKGIDALKEYSREWNEKEQTFHNHPKHNWASHAADGFRTLAMGQRRSTMNQGPKYDKAITDYDVLG